MNNQNHQQPKRATRPDKTMFFAMIAVIFILFSLPAFYWAYYSYGQYSQTTAFVEDLRKKSDTDLTPTERKERSERISLSSSRANRNLLEMALSGAGGLILSGIALLLLAKALLAMKRKNIYENVDLRTILLPTERIEVRYKIFYDILFLLIVLFFGGMLLLIFYQNFTSRIFTFENAVIRSLIFGVPILLILSLISFLTIRARRNAVRLIDNSGITRGDGKHFAWNEFCGVISQIAFNQRTQNKYVWRVEIAFENGKTAWLIPNRVKNYEEVFEYLSQLPRANLKN